MKIKSIITIILLLFLFVGCSQTNPTTKSETPSSSVDSSNNLDESVLFSSLFPNNWSNITIVFPQKSEIFLGEYYDTSEKEKIDQFYQFFSSVHLIKVDENYEDRQAEFEIVTPDKTFSLLILKSDRISVDNVVYSVDEDFTEKLDVLLDTL